MSEKYVTYCNKKDPSIRFRHPKSEPVPAWASDIRDEIEEKKELPQITISGPAGCGKSTLARVIRDALSDVNIEVKIEDDEPEPEDYTKHYAILLDRFNDVTVNLKVVQTQRKPTEIEYKIGDKARFIKNSGHFFFIGTKVTIVHSNFHFDHLISVIDCTGVVVTINKCDIEPIED